MAAVQGALNVARLGLHCSRGNELSWVDMRGQRGNLRAAGCEQHYSDLASSSFYSHRTQQLRTGNSGNLKRRCIASAGLASTPDQRHQPALCRTSRKHLSPHLSSPGQRHRQVVATGATNGSPEGDDNMSLLAPLDVGWIDEMKSESMSYRRIAFTSKNWQTHRSSGRHGRHMSSILRSRVILSLGPVVMRVTAIAAAVVGWNTLVQYHTLPPWAPLMHINPLPVTLTSSALSFLLVFRTNSSYSRFDEARKMWGLLLNRTRDFSRQALTYVARAPGQEHDVPVRAQLLRHVQAFPIVLKYHLLMEGSLEEDLRVVTDLTKSEVAGILKAQHKPNYVLQVISECLGATVLETPQRFLMDQNLTSFADDVGGCERIFKTPIPLSYTRLTSRALVIWHAFLPLALWDSCGWATIPTTFVIAASLFCVEEVGVLIEEPFSLLALDAIAGSVRGNAQEMIEEFESVRELVRTGGKAAIGSGSDMRQVEQVPFIGYPP